MVDKQWFDSFDELSVDERLSLLRSLLADVETEVRAKKLTPTAPLPDLDFVTENPFADESALDELRGGSSQSIDRLRLIDATEYLRELLQKHGYIKKFPSFDQLAQTLRLEEAQLLKRRSKADWAEWVAKDGDTLDGPKDRDWKDWVVDDQTKDAKPD